MSTLGSYKTTAFKETQKFLVIDPSTQSPSLVLGSDLVSYITPMLNYVRADTTRLSAENTDYDVGTLVQTSGATSPGDNFAATYLVVEGGTGDFPMLNGNDLLVIKGDEFLREQLADNTVGVGSDLVAHTGTADTVTEALDKRTIFVGTVAGVEALSLPVGYNVYLTQEGRAGEFVVKSGTPPSDPQKGIYIVLANGNYAMRRFDGISSDGGVHIEWFGALPSATPAENTTALQAAHDALPSLGGCIFASGEYECDGEVVFTKSEVYLRGLERRATKLIYSGALTFITHVDLTVKDMTISGKSPDGTKFFTAGSVGFAASNNLVTVNAVLTRFESIFDNNGGFYHKFYDTYFERFSDFMPDGVANNMSFFGCRASLFDRFISYTGGAGPISFYGCSFEKFTSRIVRAISGGLAAVSSYGCYYENDIVPQGWLAQGLEYDDGSGAIPFSTAKSLIIDGGLISTPGLRMASGDFEVFKSTNNYIGLADGMDYYFSGNLLFGGEFNDVVAAGTFTTDYLNITSESPSRVRIIDPFTGDDESEYPAAVEPTLINGWTQDAGQPVAYRLDENAVLHIYGAVDGNASTSTIIANIPTSITSRLPSTSYWFPVINRTTGAGVVGRVTSTGDLYVDSGDTNLIFSVSIPLQNL